MNVSVQFSRSVVSNSLQPHGLQPARPACPSPTPGACSDSCPSSRWCHPNNSSSCRPLLLLPSIFPSIRSVLHIRCPKYTSFSFSISPSNKYSGLISFRIDWLDQLAIQGTLKSLLQHHSSKASIPCSAFFMVQLSHPYMTTGKIISLTRWVIPCSSAGKESSCNGMRPQFDSWVGKICWRRNRLPIPVFLGFPGGSAGKESTWNSGDLGLIPGLGRLPGEGKGPPLQCSGLENSMDGIVHWIAKSQTWLSHFHFD